MCCKIFQLNFYIFPSKLVLFLSEKTSKYSTNFKKLLVEVLKLLGKRFYGFFLLEWMTVLYLVIYIMREKKQRGKTVIWGSCTLVIFKHSYTNMWSTQWEWKSRYWSIMYRETQNMHWLYKSVWEPLKCNQPFVTEL